MEQHHFSNYQKIKLLVLALFVESLYLLFAFIPAAVLAILSATFYGPKLAMWIGLILFIGVWWIYGQPDPIDDRHDIHVPPDSPIYTLVHELTTSLNAPRIHSIVLDDQLNAAAYTSRGFFSLIGVHRKLILGVPLLRLLSGDEMKAVIAHELGHFSRNHGKLGHWLYRVRSKWGLYLLMHRDVDDGFIESTQKLIAKRFIPYFLKQSSAWSHQCEYEADASAASIHLESHLISALAKMELHDYLRHSQIQHLVTKWQLAFKTPPIDMLADIEHVTRMQSASAFESALAHAQLRPLELFDTHPRLQQRAQALTLSIDTPVWPLSCAGAEFFKTEWPTIESAHQQRWHHKRQDSWRIEHYRLQWIKIQAELHKEDVNLQAIASATLTPTVQALSNLRTLVLTQPNNAYLKYTLGSCLIATQLQTQGEEGLEHLQAAIRLNKKMVIANLQRMHSYHAERDDVGKLTRILNRLDGAYRWRNQFYTEDLWTRLCTEQLEALPEAASELFHRAISNDPRIDGCWVGSLLSKVIDGEQFKINLLVFRMDPRRLHEEHQSEDHVRNQMANLLQTVCLPDELVYVKSIYFSETMNQNLLGNLERHQGVCITAAKQPLSKGVIKIDVL
jgi:Zn-dependent protease with chaperone function